MFLKRLKENSNQKYYKNLLKTEASKNKNGRVESIGIILNFDEFNNYDKLRKIIKNIGIKDNKVKFIAFITDDKSQPNSWDSFFCKKDFGWNAKINNTELIDFIETPFDALISYYNEDILELNLVTAMSNAKFKIGIGNHDDRLYDLKISLKTQHTDVFEKELEKYLKVLNKI